MNDTPTMIHQDLCGKHPPTAPALSTQRDTRYPVEGVEVRLSTVESGSAINVSLGGVAIETEKYLRVGHCYPLRFKRPIGEVSVRAKVVWSRLIRTLANGHGEVHAVYRSGLQFSDLSVPETRAIGRFVEEEQLHSHHRCDHHPSVQGRERDRLHDIAHGRPNH